MSLIKEEKIGTVEASKLSETFFKIAGDWDNLGKAKLTKLGNGHKLEVYSLDKNELLATYTMVDDRYTRSLYID